jgi:RNA polymerase sigma factor (sigma-70 family)
MDIADLIREAKQGSAAAQKCLFDQLANQMLAVCRRYVKNQEDAEELLLDGFLKFFKNLDDFIYRGDAALMGWIKKIMVNECLMFLRKKNVFTLLTETAAEEMALEEEALDKLSASEILSLICTLPVGYRTVFNLYEIEGLEHKEIALALGISAGTSKSQLSKARSLLQKLLLLKGNEYAHRKTK